MKSCPICEKSYDDLAEVCPVDGAILTEVGATQDKFIGKVIKGRYRVVKRLGAGGMGTVYLAEQLSIGRNVALKVLHGEFARDEEFIKRFRQEARLAATLSHRNVITVHDFDQADDGSLFIAMEHVEGRNLKELVQEGPLDVERTLRLGIQIAEGLAAAHRAGVIHRDIKPENIMLVAGTDEIKLMDFGIARLRETGTMTRLTRTGIIMGTPAYMAPEQIEGQEVSEKTDIYAFGIVLYEMLTGVVPFTAPTPSAVLIKHLKEQPLPLRELRKNIPSSVERVVMQALEKEPEKRPRSLTEVGKELEEAARQLQARTPTFRTMIEAFGPGKESQSTLGNEEETVDRYDRTRTVAETQGVEETLAETRRVSFSGRPKARKWKYVGIGGLGLLLTGAVALGIYSWVTSLVAPHIVSLRIETDRSQLEPSERARVKLRARHSDGAEKEVVEGIQWQSSDSSVATVNSSGEVEGIKPGQTEITASYEGKTSNPLWLAINSRVPPIRIPEPPIREITNLVVGARKSTIIVGERIELTTLAKYSDGSEEKNLQEVRWESSDPAVARVDESGKLEGLRQGQVRITAQYRDRMTEFMTFTVKATVQIVSLAIHVDKTELKINERLAASVKGTYSDGKVVGISKGVKWKSGDRTIADVDAEGELTAQRSGTVDIVASYGTVESLPVRFSVVADTPKLLSLRPYAEKKELEVGAVEPLKMRARYSDGKEVEISIGVRWRSSDKNVASVRSQSGRESLVIGQSAGTASISGAYEGIVSSQLTFLVKEKKPDGLPEERRDKVSPGRYKVIRYAAVYREPRPDSNVITKLGPGTIVNVVAARGEFLRIESRTGNPPGYVLRNDVTVAEDETKKEIDRRAQQQGQQAGRPVIAARWANTRSEAARLALEECGSKTGSRCKVIRSVCAIKTGVPQFGAIAYSFVTEKNGYSYRYSSREGAEARALSECGTDCKIAVEFKDSCAALAVGQTR
ncbi:MAG: protein kinase [Deltaproteobacteria bacterium]|nr:protein kinase [Deltaproteobacteria bacterium]